MAPRCLLALALLTSAVHAWALQRIEARDGVTVQAAIALKEPTRIRVEGARITDVFGNLRAGGCGSGPARPGEPAVNPGGELFLECDRDRGEIYVKPVGEGAKPVNLFVSTGHATYTLLLKRVDMPADTIVIEDRSLPPVRDADPPQAPARLRALRRLLAAMSGDAVPPGVQVEEVDRPVALWAEARFTLLRRYQGRGMTGERYLLTNVSDRPIVLAEPEFDRAGVLAVAIERHNLRPGEATGVFILRKGD